MSKKNVYSDDHSVRGNVSRILTDKFALDPKHYANNVLALCLDSIDFVELYWALEHDLKINIPDDSRAKISYSMTVAELINYVEGMVSGNSYMSVQQSKSKPINDSELAKQQGVTDLYTITDNGTVKCRLTELPCTIITADAIKNNTKMANLCCVHQCIIDKNFRTLSQKTK